MFWRLRSFSVREVDFAVGGDPLFQFIFDGLVCSNREKAAWELLGKPLFPVIRVVDRHAQHSLVQTLELLLRVSLDHESGPSLESASCKSGNIRSFFELSLDEMMLSLHLPKEPGYGRRPVIEDV